MAVQEILRARTSGFMSTLACALALGSMGATACAQQTADSKALPTNFSAGVSTDPSDQVAFVNNTKYISGLKAVLEKDTDGVPAFVKRMRALYIADGFENRLPYIDALMAVDATANDDCFDYSQATHGEWKPWEDKRVMDLVFANRNNPEKLSKIIVAVGSWGSHVRQARLNGGRPEFKNVIIADKKMYENVHNDLEGLSFLLVVDSLQPWIAKADKFAELEATAKRLETAFEQGPKGWDIIMNKIRNTQDPASSFIFAAQVSRIFKENTAVPVVLKTPKL